MNIVKLNIVNGIVIAGLVAASMLMPMVAANLAQSQGVQQHDAVTAQSTIR